MKVLFISSGNSKFGISSIVNNQGKSLEKAGIRIDYFIIKGKGLKGYIQNTHKLRKYISKGKYDLIHAHYSLSALLATLSHPKIPIIASLMGSDAKMGIFWRLIIQLNAFFFWKAVIVKSNKMKAELGLNQGCVIPNGVDLSKFKPCEKEKANTRVNLSQKKKYISFISNPSRFEKNFDLAKKSIELIKDENLILNTVFDKTHDEISEYLNSTDLLILTSFWEGSPNVIKEAMACNAPIVSTDVGDVKWVIGNTEGCYISSFEPEDVAEKIMLALNFSEIKGRTNGRDRIIELGLDTETVAKKIILLYNKVLNDSVKNQF